MKKLWLMLACLLVTTPIFAQVPALATYDDVFRAIHVDAFRQLQIATEPKVFTLDVVATKMLQMALAKPVFPAPVDTVALPMTPPVASKVNVDGMKRTITKTITIKNSPTLDQFNVQTRAAVATQIKAIAADLVANYTRIGYPPHPKTGSDSIAGGDLARGIVLMSRYKTKTETSGSITHTVYLQVIAGS